MKICQQCQTELYTEDVPVYRDFRCAVCGAQNDAGLPLTRLPHENTAWHSLALGLFCAVGILVVGLLLWFEIGWWGLALSFAVTLAGVVAAFLGISGLLKMRYQKTARSARIAAIGGMLAGGLFGVFFGGLIALFGTIIGLIALTTQKHEGPEQSLAAYQKFVQIDLPPQLNLLPYRARTSPLQIGTVDFRDHEEPEDSNLWITINQFPKWTTTNRQQFTNMLKSEIFDCFQPSKLTLDDTRQLSWEIANQDARVRRLKWTLLDGNGTDGAQTSEIEQFYSLVDVDQITYGIVLIHRPRETGLNEDDIQLVFGSLRPPGGP